MSCFMALVSAVSARSFFSIAASCFSIDAYVAFAVALRSSSKKCSAGLSSGEYGVRNRTMSPGIVRWTRGLWHGHCPTRESRVRPGALSSTRGEMYAPPLRQTRRWLRGGSSFPKEAQPQKKDIDSHTTVACRRSSTLPLSTSFV